MARPWSSTPLRAAGRAGEARGSESGTQSHKGTAPRRTGGGGGGGGGVAEADDAPATRAAVGARLHREAARREVGVALPIGLTADSRPPPLLTLTSE